MSVRRASFRLDGASLRFGSVHALDAVDLRIEPGEAVAVVGPSGAGKTTLLRLLNGSLRPTGGTVAVGGEVLVDLPRPRLREIRSSIGFVHQDLCLVPNLRVMQNVVAGRLGRLPLLASVRAMLFPSRVFVRQAHAILERVGIPDKLFERTDRLSGGQRQRVAVARALFQEPAALLADEPVSNVDPARARDVVTLLADISRERALTLCVSLHNVELAQQCFPRLVGLRHGRVVFDRSSAAIGRAELESLYRLDPRGDESS